MSETISNIEIEAKYLVKDLALVQGRLKQLGAELVEARAFEYNLRYDDPQGSLSAGRRVLRLRKYSDARLTYKGPGQVSGGALSRTEIEVVVADFDNTRLILESLGYRVAAIYEKYRTMYRLHDQLVTLDELPYGLFVEVEGESAQRGTETAALLDLDPKRAIPASYQGIFEQLRDTIDPEIRNLTFAEFKGSKLQAKKLGYKYADEK